MTSEHCELCTQPGGEIVWEDAQCRVVRVEGREASEYPGFCRVIWRAHVREMSDLPSSDRRHLMALVFATETALRGHYHPDKINLASLGNLVPHLHWHVIPRYTDDPGFPAPIWAQPHTRSAPATGRPPIDRLALHQSISRALSENQGGGA